MSDVLQELEQQKARVLSAVATLPEVQRQFRPQPASWSAMDVLDHLVKVERGFLTQVQENLPMRQRVTTLARIQAFLLNALMRLPVRVKVPKGAEHVLPSNGVLLQGTEDAWSDVRRDMRELVSQLSPEQWRVGAFQHPVSGWMPLADGLAFLSAHLRHHEFQLDRIEKAARAA